MIIFRKLLNKDLDLFIKLRIEQLKEENATDNTDLTPMLHAYYIKHLADHTFVA